MAEADGSEAFVPDDFSVPTTLDHPDFRLRPLGPEHNERDHAAWMGSVDHIQATPGFSQDWFSDPISLDDNLADLQRHARDFRERTGFTYTVLDGQGPAEGAEVIGCVYIYPHDLDGADVEVLSWVRTDHADLDGVVAATVRAWLDALWPWPPERVLDHPRHGDT